jgi:hypothetical protein
MEADRYTVAGGGENSKDIMEEFLNTAELDGLTLDIEPAESHEWGLPYEASFYGIPDGANIKFTVTRATIATKDWLTFQNHVHGESDSWESFRRGAYEPTVDRVASDIEDGTVSDIPAPVLEIKYDKRVTYDEGRSRGFGAQKAGLERMPVWIVSQDYR